MKTTVEIEWDEPQEQAWLCADNIAIALSSYYCINTKFKVREIGVAMDSERLTWAENNPEKAMGAITSWWAQAGRGYRETRFYFRNVLDSAMKEQK